MLLLMLSVLVCVAVVHAAAHEELPEKDCAERYDRASKVDNTAMLQTAITPQYARRLNAQSDGTRMQAGREKAKKTSSTSKMGLHFNGAYGQTELLQQIGERSGDMPRGTFTDMATNYVSWVDMLNYGTIDDNLAAWANKHEKEVVLMLKGDVVGSTNQGSSFKCVMGHADASKACDVGKVVEILNETIQKLDMAPKYLFGYNEPYAQGSKMKYAEPSVQAKYWADYLIPASKQLNLSLISPTADHKLMKTSNASQFGGLGWFVEFVKQCYYLKDEEAQPCDVDAIAAISIHMLSDSLGCSYDAVHEEYKEDGKFQQEFAEQMASDTSVAVPNEPNFWLEWIKARPFWIHALNCCASTSEWDDKADQCACERLSGGTFTDGVGSVRALEELPTVQRWQYVNTPFYIKTGCPAITTGPGLCSKDEAPYVDMTGPLELSGLGRAVFDIVSGGTSDPSACPIPNPPSRWVLGATGESCIEACLNAGLLTKPQAMLANPVSGTDFSNVLSEASSGDLSCSATLGSNSKKAPFYEPSTEECFYRSGDVGDDFVLNKGKSNSRRLCYCFYTTSDKMF